MDRLPLSLIAPLFAIASAAAQHSAFVQVLDLETMQPLQNVVVSCPADPDLIPQVTDENGQVGWNVPTDKYVIAAKAHSTPTHHYATRTAVSNDRIRIWMVPYSSFIKTGTIDGSGTNGPQLFQKMVDMYGELHPCTIYIDVPPGAFTDPSQIWIYPVPAKRATTASDAVFSLGEFCIELRGPNGEAGVEQSLSSAKKVTISASPWWQPAGNYEGGEVVLMRNNTHTMSWDQDPIGGSFDNSTGFITWTMSQFSCWELFSGPPLLRRQSPPSGANPPPPTEQEKADKVDIDKDNC